MIRSFRAAIGTLSLGTVLVGASALTAEAWLQRTGSRETADPSAPANITCSEASTSPIASVEPPVASVASSRQTVEPPPAPSKLESGASLPVTSSPDALQMQLVTRVYRPAVVTGDLERLIRPLLTPGVGSATTSSLETVKDPATQRQSREPSGNHLEMIVVRDLPEVVRQIDALILDVDTAARQSAPNPVQTAMPLIIPRSHVIR